ncbi:hypothetical protein [uncultured Cohaesibacter sp.]|uniref:hypothetical protein n=1 Tax=uncultured Cohaesibacter sp. TaxID=1002546 RepID=UPI00292EC106|nr:hypothetical protein [uncultured Cohaesibacter sp.]
MKSTGSYIIDANYRTIKRRLQDPDSLKSNIPNCTAIETIDDHTRLITIDSRVFPGKSVQYLFHFFDDGASSPAIEINWQGTDPNVAMPKGEQKITFRKVGRKTVLEQETIVTTTMKGKIISSDPEIVTKLVAGYFENFTKEFTKKGNGMKNDKPEFEDVLHEAENPVVELEQEAEQAAARGVFGGTEMWGLIALAVVIVFLLVFFR